MKRRQRLKLLLVSIFMLAAGVSLGLAEGPTLAGVKPNIILVITDDQGYADIGAHGHPVLKTPNLDKLRSQSLSFDAFHASPTCAPTRSAIMSGRDPFYVGVTHTIYERERLALKVPTLAEMLRENGYVTGMFGKWHLGDQDEYRPDSRGFDEVFMHGAGGIGQTYIGSSGDAPRNGYFNPYILHNNRFVKTEGFCTDVFFDQATEWMREVKDKGKPFFTYLATNAPHSPFLSPEKYKVPFAEAGYSIKQQGFYGMIANIDERMGLLMAQLDKWGIEDETILIFMSDNGPIHRGNTWNAGMKGTKGSPDEGGTRVPFFIRWPGKIAGNTTCDQLVRHYDILPTVAEIIGATPREEEKLAGRSFLPLIKNPKATADVWPDRITVIHVGRWAVGSEPAKYGKFALRSAQWRLVGDDLYDIKNDPLQKKVVTKEHPEVVKRMMKHYDLWWEKALPLMVNEDVPLEGHNTFHLMFWKQFGMAIPPVKNKK